MIDWKKVVSIKDIVLVSVIPLFDLGVVKVTIDIKKGDFMFEISISVHHIHSSKCIIKTKTTYDQCLDHLSIRYFIVPSKKKKEREQKKGQIRHRPVYTCSIHNAYLQNRREEKERKKKKKRKKKTEKGRYLEGEKRKTSHPNPLIHPRVLCTIHRYQTSPLLYCALDFFFFFFSF